MTSTSSTYLYVILENEAHRHEDQDGDDVVVERVPVGDLEGGHHGPHQHEKDGARPEHRSHHQHGLVDDVRQRDVVVDGDGRFVVGQQVHDVGHGGWGPASPLGVELAEAFRTVGVGIGGGAVLDSVASL